MTNKYKNKIKNMNFLSQPRTRTVSKEVSINKIRENYRDKETNVIGEMISNLIESNDPDLVVPIEDLLPEELTAPLVLRMIGANPVALPFSVVRNIEWGIRHVQLYGHPIPVESFDLHSAALASTTGPTAYGPR